MDSKPHGVTHIPSELEDMTDAHRRHLVQLSLGIHSHSQIQERGLRRKQPCDNLTSASQPLTPMRQYIFVVQAAWLVVFSPHKATVMAVPKAAKSAAGLPGHSLFHSPVTSDVRGWPCPWNHCVAPGQPTPPTGGGKCQGEEPHIHGR